MRIALFYHSVRSDWNHGNAHFLRGVATELIFRGHRVTVFEPADAWSVRNLIRDEGEAAADGYRNTYPDIVSRLYTDDTDFERLVDGFDLVIVHEWNDPALVERLGRLRGTGSAFRLLFHDTHHRSLTDREGMAAYDLRHYDGVLAFGEAVRRRYIEEGWAERAWTWHEAADIRVFRPLSDAPVEGDVVWVGNWGDDERTSELDEFLLRPSRALNMRTRIYGVRYPRTALHRLEQHGVTFGGWLPNYRVPEVFSRYRATVHVPRRPYVRSLPGIPTIRPFEALACAIPLVCAPWEDVECLFEPGRDYLVAQDGAQMRRHLRDLLNDTAMAEEIATHGYRTLLARHTCAHRVDELLGICREIGIADGFNSQGER